MRREAAKQQSKPGIDIAGYGVQSFYKFPLSLKLFSQLGHAHDSLLTLKKSRPRDLKVNSF